MKKIRKTTLNKNTRLWSEGKHLDLWSLVHLLGGGVLAGGLFLLNFNTNSILLISFIILISWEIIEIILGIKEHETNILSDIIIGFAGSIIVLYLMKSNIVNNLYFFIILAVIFIISDIFGYISYVRRK
jgi:uncharacterized membrane protein YjjP (DUF1212 family)